MKPKNKWQVGYCLMIQEKLLKSIKTEVVFTWTEMNNE